MLEESGEELFSGRSGRNVRYVVTTRSEKERFCPLVFSLGDYRWSSDSTGGRSVHTVELRWIALSTLPLFDRVQLNNSRYTVPCILPVSVQAHCSSRVEIIVL